LADPAIRVYWDSCAWIGFFNEEPDKMTALRKIWEDGQKGKYEIYTSTFSYIEVLHGKTLYGESYNTDEKLEEYDGRVFLAFDQSHVKRAQLDTEVAKLARAFRRLFHPSLTKRADAVHLATASYYNCEEMHTYDDPHLIPLNGRVKRRDGADLKILKPRLPDVPDLFTPIENDRKP
jgi:predicted nucleic acid-binding protein